jgi:photosystem II stability/assembly factor-like uncharacterized protein
MIRKLALLLLLSSGLAVDSHARVWTSHGPSGGSTRTLVAANGNPRQLYVASSGGVFRSDDAGVTWRDITGPVSDPTELAVAPSSPDVIVAATGGASRKLYRTDDGGVTWRAIGGGLPPLPNVSSIAIDPRDPRVVYAGLRCGAIFGRGPVVQWHESAGFFKSTDGGASFFQSSHGMSGFQICVEELSIDPLNPDRLYATPVYSDSKWARSDDAGATWRTVDFRVPGGGIVVDPEHQDVAFGTGMGTLLRSHDRGATWEMRIPTALDTGRPVFIGAFSSVALDPATHRLFAGGPLGVYRTGDEGSTVFPLGGPAREHTIGLVFDPATNALTIGTLSGVYQSNGWPWDQWRVLDTGDHSRPTANALPSRRDPRTVFAASASHVFVTRDDGMTWATYAGPLPQYRYDQRMRFEAIDANDTIYAVGVNDDGSHSLYRRMTGADAWIHIPLPFLHTIGRVYVHDDEPQVVYVTSSSVTYRTKDSGATWEPASPRIPSPIQATGHAVIARADPNVVYVRGRNVETLDFVLYRSDDGGLSWTQRALPPEMYETQIAVDPRDANTLYIGAFTGRVYSSHDGGASWTSLGALPGGLRALALNHDGSVLHAATDRGMWELRIGARRMRAVR